MNCIEVRALVEDALDKSVAGSRKRALDLHLSRCDSCRAFFAAECDEHRRWFLAMNEPAARQRLPAGFADGFLADVVRCNARPQRRWLVVAKFGRIAAGIAAALLFTLFTYAAVVVVDRIGDGDVANSGSPESPAPGESSALSTGQADQDEAVHPDEGATIGEGIAEQPEYGESTMKKGKMATAALTLALAAGGPALAYNSLAPHDNTENTEFWDTRGYNVEPASSAAGVCDTDLFRLVRTEATSWNVVHPFRRVPAGGICVIVF